jgi:hypothetical protein
MSEKRSGCVHRLASSCVRSGSIAQQRFGSARVAGDISGLQQAGDDDDAARSRGDHGFEVLELDSADAKDGDPRARVRHPDLLQADRGTAWLGGRGEQRAEADVVRAFFSAAMACARLCVDLPMMGGVTSPARARPARQRASATEKSSCPTCAPWAPTEGTNWGWSFKISGMPALSVIGASLAARRSISDSL